MDEVWLSKTELATALKRTTRWVEKAQAQADFPESHKEGRKRLYPLSRVFEWFVEREIEQRIGEADGETLDIVQERAKLAKVQQQRQALLLAKERGELVAIEDVCSAVGDDYSNVRARLLALPPKCAPLVHRAESVHEIREVLDEAVREALEELSDPENFDPPPPAEEAA